MKKTNSDKVTMAVAGVIIFLLLPKDPWSFGQTAYLFFCSLIGSIASIFFKQKYYQLILIAVIIGTFLFVIGTFVFDITLELNRNKYILEFIMWLPLLIINCLLYVGAITFIIFPIVTSGICKIKKKKL